MDFLLNKIDKQWENHRSLDQNICYLKRKLQDLKALKEDTESRMRAELHPRKKIKKEVHLWLGDVERIEGEIQNLDQRVNESSALLRGSQTGNVLKKIEEVIELLQQGKFDQGLVVDDFTWIGQSLSTTTLFGQAAETCMKEIWGYLMDDDIRKIGVWGMGGVGKTSIMKLINNQLLRQTEKFDIVIWITVSKEMNIFKIQEGISDAMKEELSRDKDEAIRAGMIYEMLTRIGRYVLILDDLWHKLSLEEVGIPEPSNGSKLVVTTRKLDVCRYLDCQEVKLHTLPKQDAKRLFLEKVGGDVLNNPDLLPIVESVAEQCAGLPLAIVTVASSMKGISNVCEWRNALNELTRRVKSVAGLDEKVFQQLQFSYDHLEDELVKRCFLCCSLYPEDQEISYIQLIELWLAEGLVQEMNSWQAEFDQGYTILNKLKNNCLLENGESADYVKLHDLVRDMALRITSIRPRFLVKAGMQLKEIPPVQEWTEDLEMVSLMKSTGLRIPSQMSPPKCQMLTTLLLSSCYIKSIPHCFFEQMKGLKVLDLSFNSIKSLPSSVSNLEGLTVLLLNGCYSLKKVPSFSKLQALKKLDLGHTNINYLPQGMERLINLNYLDLDIKQVPTGILSKFSCLKHLVASNLCGNSKAFVRGEEIAGLKKLEFFEGRFYDLNELNIYLQALLRHGRPWPRKYCISVTDRGLVSGCIREKSIEVHASKIYKDGANFPSDLQQLSIAYGRVEFCEEEAFFPWFIPEPNGMFSYLKEINISFCKRLKKLFSCCWVLRNIRNLEVLTVRGCKQMEEVIASETEFVEKEGTSSRNSMEFSLPKLRKLELCSLPKLKSICSANRVMVCDSLEEIHLESCLKLHRIPLYLPLLDDGQASPPPSLKKILISSEIWWKSVEFDHCNAKSLLQPFLFCN
ncbi:hypothetical protein PTKIN_Ptkin11bG0153100 [Pterospermum kingtungense]